LSALWDPIQCNKSCQEPFSAQHDVGNTLHGLQGMTSDRKEVLQLLLSHVYLRWWVRCNHAYMEPFSGQAVGNALYGFLQGMSSDKREVLQATISCVGGSGAIVSGASR